MIDTNALKYATIVLLVVAAVFIGVSAAVNTINADDVAEPLKEVVIVVQTTFAMPAVVFIVTWVRNVYGYYRAKVKAATDATVSYSLQKLYDSVMLYVGSGVAFMLLIPAPYNLIGTAVLFILDLVASELRYLMNML